MLVHLTPCCCFFQSTLTIHQAKKADASASEVMPNVETSTPGDPKLCSVGSRSAAAENSRENSLAAGRFKE